MSAETKNEMPGVASVEALRARISRAYASQSRAADEERWILDNLPMVRHIAGKIAACLPQHADMEDLISAGTLGLVRAARAYDPEKNAEFGTYAYIRIRGSILDELRGKTFVPWAVYKQMREIERAYRALVAKNGAPPGDAELSTEAGMSEQDLYRVLRNARSQHFLSIHGLGDEGPSMNSLAPVDKSPLPDQQAQRKELVSNMTDAIKELPKRDRLMLLLYYERDLSMKEIAQVLGVTESRVSQLHASALFKLSMKLG